MAITKKCAIRLIAHTLLSTATLFAAPVEVLAGPGYTGAYPGYPYGRPALYRPNAMPAQPRPVVYGYPAYRGYPAYAYPGNPAMRPARPQAAAPALRPASQPVAAKTSPATGSDVPAQGELPAALADADLSTDQRKRMFIDALLPVVARENERLLGLRQQLADLQTAHTRGKALSAARQAWLRGLADDYRIDADADPDVMLEKLLRRVDVIPAGLAIAQAANESAWGSSRFARQGNNLFGIWTYDADQGMKPLRRAAGKTHLVRSYDSIEDSVRDYIHNLNSHPAYQPLRERRTTQRKQEQPLSALQLAEGLAAYSEQGEVYIELIQSMIRANQLEQVAQLQLADAR